jgi:Cu/Ag efflux pump CusA
LLFETSFQAQFLIPMATALAFGLATTTLLVLILVPVMYSFFGTSAREEHEEEYLGGATTASSVDPDEAEQEWLPDHLREPAVR